MARITRHVALLRGVNVGGKNKLSMKDLAQLFDDLGFQGATTYIQSGNVVFGSDESDPVKIGRAIEEGINAYFGCEAVAIIRNERQLQALMRTNPFLEGGVIGTLHVTFLAGKTSAEQVKAITPVSTGSDAYAIVGQHVFLRCPHGYGRTKLNNSFWEKRLEMPATTRNWRTTVQLLEMMAS